VSRHNARRSLGLRGVCAVALALGLALPPGLATPIARAQPVTPPNGRSGLSPTPELRGRVVEDVRVVGNRTVPTGSILNLVRTRPGEPYDPHTVQEDYQRIYRGLRRFTNVTARVEPAGDRGVVVVFDVQEQRSVNRITFRGNRGVEDSALRNAVDLRPGEAIDPFRLRLAESAIETLYRERSYPFARVSIARGPLEERGDLVFEIVEGPNVRVREVDFVGAKFFKPDVLFGRDPLNAAVKTRPWQFVLNPGRYDPEQIEQDVAALRRLYESKGFFDVRVGRKLQWSPDQSEVQVQFLIDEGPRYTVAKLLFEGNTNLGAAEIRRELSLVEGRPYDGERLQRDIRKIVQAYSPLGYIYQEGGFNANEDDPDYLYIDPRPVFHPEAGTLDLVYAIREGKPFRVGRIIVKGNYKTKDNVILRDMRFAPGSLFNSGAVVDARERLRARRFFDSVSVTAIGNDPTYRDILVEVLEGRTADLTFSAAVNSNGGFGAGVRYEQRNFDVGNPPHSIGEFFSDRAFTGAGQTFRATFEPGSIATNASLFFSEQFLFDQPYEFAGEVYIRDRKREHYDDRRAGARVTFGRRFGYEWGAAMTLRGEDVQIDNIDDPPLRPPELLLSEGHNTLTSASILIKRETLNPGVFFHRGSLTTGKAEFYGALGGDYHFQKFEVNWDRYTTLREDLNERKTVLGLHANAGYINGDSVFFERFYAGGLGSMRGFDFRGISPRAGLDEDPVGGEFILTGSVEVNFPLVGESLRGVVFTDFGTVEEELEITTIRTSVGTGLRFVLPVLGTQMPLSIDFAYPLTRGEDDETQIISFSFGFTQ